MQHNKHNRIFTSFNLVTDLDSVVWLDCRHSKWLQIDMALILSYHRVIVSYTNRSKYNVPQTRKRNYSKFDRLQNVSVICFSARIRIKAWNILTEKYFFADATVVDTKRKLSPL